VPIGATDPGSDPSPVCVARSAVATPIEILAALPPERLRVLVDAAPRRVREELFRSAGIRTKSSTYSLRGNDKAARYGRLKVELEAGTVASGDAAEEVIRSYLGQQSTLLGDALDHFEVPHRDGFTDEDLDFMEKLGPREVEAFRSDLRDRGHADADIELYCQYMKVPQS
jgi:hypothetical protein